MTNKGVRMLTSRYIAWFAGIAIGCSVLNWTNAPITAASEKVFLEKTNKKQSKSTESPLWGTVTTITGELLEGVPVSARALGKTVTTSVFTDEKGQYFFPPLGAPFEKGKYHKIF